MEFHRADHSGATRKARRARMVNYHSTEKKQAVGLRGTGGASSGGHAERSSLLLRYYNLIRYSSFKLRLYKFWLFRELDQRVADYQVIGSNCFRECLPGLRAPSGEATGFHSKFIQHVYFT